MLVDQVKLLVVVEMEEMVLVMKMYKVMVDEMVLVV